MASCKVTADTEDAVGNPATANDTSIKDIAASLSTTFLDSVYNKAEIDGDQVQFNVQLTNFTASLEGPVSASNPVTLSYTVTDILGASINGEFSMSADDQSFTLDAATINSLAEGNLSLSVSAQDTAGNPATDTDNAVKDTIASIGLSFDGDSPIQQR